MKKIDISTPKYPNTFALVDDDDYEYLNNYKWRTFKKKNITYVIRSGWDKINKKDINIKIHKDIMNPPKGMVVDHINHNGLDNRKCNLRICTPKENTRNGRPHKNVTSKYKGVYFTIQKIKYKNKIYKYPYWKARISHNNKDISLGKFKTEKKAAKMYNCAARILFGEYAYLNIL